MNIWLQLVKVPEISVGESYFMISGTKELNNPAHIPWTSLENSKVW